jgi:hypothetical protein
VTQCDRILELLQQRPRTCAEILQEVPCIVHSRVSDLRARGYEIEHETTGVGAAGSLYRLVGSPPVPRVEGAADCLGPDSALSTGETDDAASAEQLTLIEAA